MRAITKAELQLLRPTDGAVAEGSWVTYEPVTSYIINNPTGLPQSTSFPDEDYSFATATLPQVVVSGRYIRPPISNYPTPSSQVASAAPAPAAPAPCPAPLTPAVRVDVSYVITDEGGVRLTGYTLPQPKFPNSGVTIGGGVDLGYQTPTTLAGQGISQDAYNALLPFVGLRGSAASSAMASNGPPVISQTDADTLTNNVFAANLAQAVAQFNNKSPQPFATLPNDVQTVIADLAFNTPNLQQAAPNFFSQITTGQWAAAAQNLLNWTPTGSDARHTRLGNKLARAIANGAVPVNSQTCG